MVQISALFALSAAFTLTSALPLEKRIAQVIAESTAEWEKACVCILYPSYRRPFSHEIIFLRSPPGVLVNATPSLRLLSPACWLQARTAINRIMRTKWSTSQRHWVTIPRWSDSPSCSFNNLAMRYVTSHPVEDFWLWLTPHSAAR
jgi:hypothetical protein